VPWPRPSIPDRPACVRGVGVQEVRSQSPVCLRRIARITADVEALSILTRGLEAASNVWSYVQTLGQCVSEQVSQIVAP